MLRLFVVLVVICRLAGQGNAFKTPMPSVATRMISLYSRSNFIQNNDLSKNCKISDDSLALENIANGQDMFVLPQGLCLDVKKAEAKFRPEGVTADRLRTGNFGMLAILLLAEKYAGEKSKYRDYVASLPTVPAGIMAWTDEEIEALAKCTTRNVKTQMRAVEDDFATLSKVEPAPLAVGGSFSLEEFKWAMGHVKARHIFLGDEPVLAPGLDVADFDAKSRAEPMLAGAGVFGGKVVKVSADRDYKKGQHVVISYGLKSSAQCLEDHGMVPEIQTVDCSCEILVTLDEGDKFVQDKLRMLETEGLRPSATFDLEADTELDIDPLLMQFARAKFISGSDSFILEPCLSGVAWEQLGMPFSKTNEAEVIDYLSETCVTLLRALSPPETNSPMLNSGRKTLMTALLAQERAALEGTLARLRVEKDSLEGSDSREYYQERRLRELDLLRPLDESEVVLSGEGGPGYEDDDYSVY